MYLGQFSDHTKTAQRTRDRIRQLGTTLDGKRLWTTGEDDICRRAYPDYRMMMKALPHRTLPALKDRCRRHLAITRTRKDFTTREIQTLRATYPSLDMPAILKLLPGRNVATLHAKAAKLGLSRPKQRYKSTGNYLLDALRTHCDAEGYRMSDLDEFAACRYFRRRGWQGTRGCINYNHIVRAIHELGGRLRIEWDDQS